MALSKSTKILILLVVDTCFFFLELITGYAVHSLALVADSFHMLNDVISLLVGLWAVKVANRDTESKMYTYGWQRAETLGALVNGVFLIALCVSIFLEAIQRFVEPQTVSQPQIIFVVGCLGLLSNILGLLLFHDHGHAHGHDHGHAGHDALSEAENGQVHSPEAQETDEISDQSGNIADVLPQNVVGAWSKRTVKHPKKSHTFAEGTTQPIDNSDHKHGIASSPEDHAKQTPNIQKPNPRERHNSYPRYSSYSEASLQVHPAFLRNDIITRGSEVDAPSPVLSEAESDSEERDQPAATENEPLLGKINPKNYKIDTSGGHTRRIRSMDLKHDHHNHRGPKKETQSHGHSHGDLNMRGVFLHVMGDALGNVGVIATALFIWGTDFSWRFYSDPAISLVITVIILCSAIPLCRAASRILLQAVPAGVSIDEIKEDIEKLPGVVSCHHIHVWQLSDTKLVASLHVMLGFDFEGVGKKEYMRLSSAIRTCLKEYGIRNPTIQAEFCLDDSHTHQSDGTVSPKDSVNGRDNNSLHGGPSACVWESGDRAETCCPSESRKT